MIKRGGAIYNYGTLILNNTLFESNTASKYDGGAIANYGPLTISNSTFNGNTANDQGGAIYIYYGTLNVTESVFENNRAGSKGGAICNLREGIYQYVSYSNFTNNSANGRWYSGGALYFSDGRVNAVGNIFTNNHGSTGETIDCNGWWTAQMENNTYISTDIAIKGRTINTKDDQTTFNSTDDIILACDISLQNGGNYKDFKTGIRGITLYIDGESRETNYEEITLNNLKPGPHTAYFTLMGKQSNTLTFYVIGESEISTPQASYEYIEGANTKIPLVINDGSGLTGTVNVTVKDQGNYKLLSTYYNVGNGYKISAETLVDELENIYGTLDSSYTINITYSSKYTHPSSTEFKISKLKKVNTPISLDVQTYENNAKITATVNTDATGIVKFQITGPEKYSLYVDVINGHAILEDVLKTGNYNVVATYMGDSTYNAHATSKDFKIIGHIMKDTPIDANIESNANKVKLTVTVDESATGFVEVKNGDSVVNIGLKNGKGTYTTTLPYGSYNLDITYLGDENYNKNSTKCEFTLIEPTKESTPISLDVESVENNVTFNVKVNSNATGIVKFQITGQEEYILYVDVVDGKAILEDILKTGNYTVFATYMGDNRYNTTLHPKTSQLPDMLKRTHQLPQTLKQTETK